MSWLNVVDPAAELHQLVRDVKSAWDSRGGALHRQQLAAGLYENRGIVILDSEVRLSFRGMILK